MKPATERLAAAKAALAAMESQISAAVGARARAIMEDDERAAAALDRELIELKLAAQRWREKIEMLPALIANEEREQEWPSTVPGLKKAIARKSARLRQLDQIPRLEHSAVTDTERDHLRQRIPALRARLEHLEAFEAAP
jgi:hypothetical protein